MLVDIDPGTDDAGNPVYVLLIDGDEASRHPTIQELYLELQRRIDEMRRAKAAEEDVRALKEAYENFISENFPDGVPDGVPTGFPDDAPDITPHL